jgi:hypothetical protein
MIKSDMDKLALDLPDDVAAFIAEAAGGDLNADAAHDFVRQLIASEKDKLERLRTDIQAGLDSEDTPFSIGDIFDQAVERTRSRAA